MKIYTSFFKSLHLLPQPPHLRYIYLFKNIHLTHFSYQFYSHNKFSNFSNLWLLRHKFEDCDLSEFVANLSTNDDFSPKLLHMLSVADKFDPEKLNPTSFESQALDMLENFNPKDHSLTDLSHLLYFICERGVLLTDNLFNKLKDYANNSPKVSIALTVARLSHFLSTSTSLDKLDISENMYNNEIKLCVTDLAYLNMISVICLKNSTHPALTKLNVNSLSFLNNVVYTYNFTLASPSEQRLNRERQEAKEVGIVSEPLQIGAFYYPLVNVKLKEIYFRRQSNDYIDRDCRILRPFVLWKEAYARANDFKLVEF